MAKAKKIKRRRRRRKNPNGEAVSVRGGGATDLAYTVGAGFAGYAATRLVARATYSQVIKRFPKAAKHAGVIASAVGAVGAYYGSKHWDKVSDYHEAITIGAGVALLQSAVQTYLPKYGWIVCDYNVDQYVKKSKAVTAADIPAKATPELEAASDFSLDRLLAENNDLEAVPIGQASPVEETAFEDDLENHNGMLN